MPPKIQFHCSRSKRAVPCFKRLNAFSQEITVLVSPKELLLRYSLCILSSDVQWHCLYTWPPLLPGSFIREGVSCMREDYCTSRGVTKVTSEIWIKEGSHKHKFPTAVSSSSLTLFLLLSCLFCLPCVYSLFFPAAFCWCIFNLSTSNLVIDQNI